MVLMPASPVLFAPVLGGDVSHEADLAHARLGRVPGGRQLVVTYAHGHAAARAQAVLVVVEGEHPVAFGLVPFAFRRVPGDAPVAIALHAIGGLPPEPALVADAEPGADPQFPDEPRIILEAWPR